MSNSIFTLVYSKDHQTRFERAIKEKCLDFAQEQLKKLPPAKNTLEEIHRVIILAQGYRALAESRKEALIHTLAEYHSLGTIHEIKVEKELLNENKSLGTIESIRSKLSKISQFEDSAKKIH